MSDFIQDLWIYQHRELLENYLFWVALFSLLLIGIITRNPKEGWLLPFPPERPLPAMIREAIAACFSRWWIIGLPLIVTLIGPYEKDFLLWLSSRRHPDIALAWRSGCSAILARSSNLGVKDRLAGVANQALQSASNLLQLRQSFILAAILALGILIWIIKTRRREDTYPVKTDPLRVWLYGLALIVLVIAAAFFARFTLNLMNLDNVEYIEWNALIIGIPLYGFGLPALLSIWFAAVILTVADWDEDPDKKWFGGYFSTPPLLLKLTFCLFPAFIFFGMIDILLGFLGYLSVNIIGNLTRAISIVVSWSFLPLPFLIARHDLDLGKSFRWLGKIWRQHFFKLLSLVLIIIVASAIGGILEAFYQMIRDENAIYEECEKFYLQPDPILFVIEMVRTLLNLCSFLLVAIAFQSGALDLPSENNKNL